MKSLSIRRLLIFFIAPIVSLSILTACSDDDTIVDIDNGDDNGELNIVEVASEDPRFSTLVDLVGDAGLVDILSNEELTVFAPTNSAFDALFDILDENGITLTPEQLVNALTYHVTEGTIPSSALEAQQDVEMVNEELTIIQASAAGVLINGRANVIEANINATNGIIHAIDEVILPTELRVAVEGPSLVELAQEAGDFNTLLSLVEQGGLTTTLQFLGPYTAFAPNDAAFDALFSVVDPETLSEEQLAFILTYHVIVGGAIFSGDLAPQQTVQSANEEELFITAGEEGVFVNGSTQVINADLEASNGVIHVVEDVLLPNAFLNTVQVASKNYNFTTLVGLLSEYPDLVEAVATSDITVFAPTNSAFDTLFESVDPATLTEEQIANILLYHTIIGAQVFAGDLEDEQTVESGSEEALYITADDEGVVVNGSSNVVTADVTSTNGVIHAIDEVLLPNAFTPVTGIVAKNYDLTTLLSAVAERADILATLSGEGTFTVFAPTNAAFDAAFEAFPNLTSEQITEILTYHVLTSVVLSSDLSDGQTAETLQGEEISVSIDGGAVQINNSNVVTVDLEGTNGVVHIIDAVLVPPSFLD